MQEFPRKRHAVSGWMVRVALIAVILRTPLQAENISLQGIVTPSTTILRDGHPVAFALHGFIEFKSLAELFPYIETQTQRWNLGIEGGQRLTRELLRRGIESRVVSMTDERPLEVGDAYQRGAATSAGAREGAGAARLRQDVSGSAGEMEALPELLERFTVNSRTSAI
jgi:hypothetical protein